MGHAQRLIWAGACLLAIVLVGQLATAGARPATIDPQSYLPAVVLPETAPEATGTPSSGTPERPEIRFTGTALERFDAPCCDQLSWWRVQVGTVQEGAEKCRGEEVTVLFGSGFLVRLGYVDPAIRPGDRVEVYGYPNLIGAACSADLIERRHYIRRTGHLSIDPPQPRATDPISLTVTGLWGSSCPRVIHSFGRVRGNVIQMVAGVTDAEKACMTVVSGWRYTEPVGSLPAGSYQVLAEVVDLGGGGFGFRERLEFDVLP